MNLCSKGRQLIIDEKERQINDFDSIIVDALHTVDDGDDALIEIAEAAGRAHYAEAETRDTDRHPKGNPAHKYADDAIAALHESLMARVEELIAEECAHVINNAHDWHWDDDQVAEAKREARDWLETHHAVAKNVGVFHEVEA